MYLWRNISRRSLCQACTAGERQVVESPIHQQPLVYPRVQRTEEHEDIGAETTGDQGHMLLDDKLGTDQSDSLLVWEDKEYIGISRNDNRVEPYVCIAGLDGVTEINKETIKIIDESDSKCSVRANDEFNLLKDKDTTLPQVVTSKPPEVRQEGVPSPTFEPFIPEDADGRIVVNVATVNSQAFVAKYSNDLKDEISVVSSEGRTIKRLENGVVGTSWVTANGRDDFFFGTFSRSPSPAVIKKYLFASPDAEPNKEDDWIIFRKTLLKAHPDDKSVTIQVWYTSDDGSQVPMIIGRHDNTIVCAAPARDVGISGLTGLPWLSVKIYGMKPSYEVNIVTHVRGFDALEYIKSREKQRRPQPDVVVQHPLVRNLGSVANAYSRCFLVPSYGVNSYNAVTKPSSRRHGPLLSQSHPSAQTPFDATDSSLITVPTGGTPGLQIYPPTLPALSYQRPGVRPRDLEAGMMPVYGGNVLLQTLEEIGLGRGGRRPRSPTSGEGPTVNHRRKMKLKSIGTVVALMTGILGLICGFYSAFHPSKSSDSQSSSLS